MKKKFVLIMVCGLLLLSVNMVAQVGDPGGDPHQPPPPIAPPGSDPELVPIDDYLCFLGGIAILYVFYNSKTRNLCKK